MESLGALEGAMRGSSKPWLIQRGSPGGAQTLVPSIFSSLRPGAKSMPEATFPAWVAVRTQFLPDIFRVMIFTAVICWLGNRGPVGSGIHVSWGIY
jgi:hypothetical protein